MSVMWPLTSCVFVWLREADPASLWGRRMWHVPGELWTCNQTSLQQPLVSYSTRTTRTQNPLLNIQQLTVFLSLQGNRLSPLQFYLSSFLPSWPGECYWTHTQNIKTVRQYSDVQYEIMHCAQKCLCEKAAQLRLGPSNKTIYIMSTIYCKVSLFRNSAI